MPISNFCEDCHREYLDNVWLKKYQNYSSSWSSILNFSPQYGPVLKKISVFSKKV